MSNHGSSHIFDHDTCRKSSQLSFQQNSSRGSATFMKQKNGFNVLLFEWKSRQRGNHVFVGILRCFERSTYLQSSLNGRKCFFYCIERGRKLRQKIVQQRAYQILLDVKTKLKDTERWAHINSCLGIALFSSKIIAYRSIYIALKRNRKIQDGVRTCQRCPKIHRSIAADLVRLPYSLFQKVYPVQYRESLLHISSLQADKRISPALTRVIYF